MFVHNYEIHAFWNTHIKYKKPIIRNIDSLTWLTWLKLYLKTISAMTLWNQHVILCRSGSCVLLIDKSNERCKFSTYRSSRPKMFCKKGVLLLWRTSEQLLLDLMVLLILLLILKWLPSNWSYPLNRKGSK